MKMILIYVHIEVEVLEELGNVELGTALSFARNQDHRIKPLSMLRE